MADMPTRVDPLTAAIEQMKSEAYAAGWKDAFEMVSAAIASISNGVELGIVPPPLASQPPRMAESGSLPTVGTTPYYVYQAVSKKPGMTGSDVVAAVRAEGHDVAEPQIRTALSRLEKRQLLANRHRKWFLK